MQSSSPDPFPKKRPTASESRFFIIISSVHINKTSIKIHPKVVVLIFLRHNSFVHTAQTLRRSRYSKCRRFFSFQVIFMFQCLLTHCVLCLKGLWPSNVCNMFYHFVSPMYLPCCQLRMAVLEINK